jgi:putative transcription factor
MECEICGKETNKIFITEIEGTVLRLCEECSRGGRILNIIEGGKKIKENLKPKMDFEDEEYDLVENYGEIIADARNKMNLSIEELAKKIGEKESLLRKIEKEEIRPSDKVIDKLERFLKIKLREKIESKPKKDKKEEDIKLRIADVVKIRD